MWGKPLLCLMSHPDLVFMRALRRFKRLALYANVFHDRPVPCEWVCGWVGVRVRVCVCVCVCVSVVCECVCVWGGGGRMRRKREGTGEGVAGRGQVRERMREREWGRAVSHQGLVVNGGQSLLRVLGMWVLLRGIHESKKAAQNDM